MDGTVAIAHLRAWQASDGSKHSSISGCSHNMQVYQYQHQHQLSASLCVQPCPCRTRVVVQKIGHLLLRVRRLVSLRRDWCHHAA